MGIRAFVAYQNFGIRKLQKALLGGGPGRWEIKPENEHEQFILWGMGKDLERFGVKMFVGDSDELDSANIISTPDRKGAGRAMETKKVTTVEKSRSREAWKEVNRRKLDEYGNETYADPIHHSYPLTVNGKPSRKETMAAWDYINQRKNAAKYTPEDLARVKGRIRRFAKHHFDEDLQDVQKSRTGIRAYVEDTKKDGIRALVKAKKAHRFAFKTDERDPIFIPVNRIRTPYQTEEATNPDKVNENIKKIKAGMSMPPLVVGYDYDLHDGHHRLEAAKKSGHTHVPCIVGGADERRVNAAEKRYRAVWKSRSADERLRRTRDAKGYLTPSERGEARERFGSIQCSIARDKDGYYAYTHRARSKSYPSIAELPKKVVQFISSTA